MSQLDVFLWRYDYIWGFDDELKPGELTLYPSVRPGYVVLDFAPEVLGGLVCDRKALIEALEALGNDPDPSASQPDSEMQRLDSQFASNPVDGADHP